MISCIFSCLILPDLEFCSRFELMSAIGKRWNIVMEGGIINKLLKATSFSVCEYYYTTIRYYVSSLCYY